MAENQNIIKDEQCHRGNNSLTEATTYDFDKNSFVVEPVFKKENSETLGAILLRLMTQRD